MSIICQYDKLKNACYPGDLTRKVAVEAKLKLPDDGPKLGSIVGGDFLVESTVVVVEDDLLIVSGKLCARLVFTGENHKSHEHHHKHHEDGASNDEGRDEETNANLPLEYSHTWPGDNGVPFEERIEMPGLRKDMTVQVEARAGACVYEKNGGDRVAFRAELHLTVHVAYNQSSDIMSDIILQGPEKLTVNKERVTTEEVVGLRKGTLPVRTSLMLPGIKPGIARILNHQVRPSGISCETSRGRVLIKGYLEISMIYVGADDAGVPTEVFVNDWSRDSGTAVPFEAFLDNNIPEEDTIIVPKVYPRNVTLEAGSPHEAHLKMDLECEAKVSRAVPQDMVVSVTPEAKEIIDTQKYMLNFEEYGGEATGEISLDLTLDLPGDQAALERALSYRGVFGEFKTEVSGNSVTVEGSLDLWLCYVTGGAGDSGMRVAGWERSKDNTVPVAGMVEFQNLQPGALFNTHVSLESLHIEPANERSFRVTGMVRVRVIVRNPRAIFVLKDCAVVTPVEPSTRPAMMFYIVQPGDTLWKIARRYQTTVDALVKANQIANPDLINVGQKLLIPKQIA